MRNKFASLMLLALVLSGCGTGKLQYDVSFDTDNQDRVVALSATAHRIIERRLERLEGVLLDYDIEYEESNNEAKITLEIEPQEVAEQLSAELTAPIEFEIRINVEDGGEGDIEVEKHGFFRATGIVDADIDWLIPGNIDNPNVPAFITLGFTEEGAQKARTLFAENPGSNIGIFVRGMMVAKLGIDDQEIDRTIVIAGIPSAELATIFADDVNVGVHMTFTRTQ